jgi:hypothetical protein
MTKYRSVVKIGMPLTDLTKKGKATIVEWSEACEKSFNDLKSALSAEPVLKSPDFDKHFYLQVLMVSLYSKFSTKQIIMQLLYCPYDT